MLVKKRELETEVDLTPMIDCVFQLIIFFMVALSMAVVYGVVIKFPEQSAPSKAKSKSKEKIITVYIKDDWIGKDHKVFADGIIKVLDQDVPLWTSQDPNKMEKERQEGWDYIQNQMDYLLNAKGFDKKMIIIKGDVKTYHWKVVKIIDIAKGLKVESFSLVPPYS